MTSFRKNYGSAAVGGLRATEANGCAISESGNGCDADAPHTTTTSPLLSRCRSRCSSRKRSFGPFPGGSGDEAGPIITAFEARNLLLLALSYTCVASSTTVIVGGSAVVVISVGGGSDIAPIALSSFFGGSSLISLVTGRLFGNRLLGRKGGFVVGSVLGMVGGAIGAAAVALSSPGMVVASAFPVGCANGVGMHLRFAAMEVVGVDEEDEGESDGDGDSDSDYDVGEGGEKDEESTATTAAAKAGQKAGAKSLAMTLVLSGGCLAAFLGPESQAATRYTFGEDLEYLGLFVMIVIFNAISATLVSFVRFPPAPALAVAPSMKGGGTNGRDGNPATSSSLRDGFANEFSDDTPFSALALARQFDFVTSAALATLSWSIMAMPMSIVRVAMNELGYTARQSLTTLELHFLGMFAPGFVTGGLIQRFGTPAMRWSGLILFCAAIVANLVSKAEDDVGGVGSWMAGLATLGVGWNVTFATATVMLAETYRDAPELATKIQAANDFVMFGIAGALIVSTGYIFQAGGSGQSGWILLNLVVLSFLCVMLALLLVLAWRSDKGKDASRTKSLELTDFVDEDEASPA